MRERGRTESGNRYYVADASFNGDRGLGRCVITHNVDVPPLTHIHSLSKRAPSLLSA